MMPGRATVGHKLASDDYTLAGISPWLRQRITIVRLGFSDVALVTEQVAIGYGQTDVMWVQSQKTDSNDTGLFRCRRVPLAAECREFKIVIPLLGHWRLFDQRPVGNAQGLSALHR
jgi:hypothetical protein